MRDDDKWPEVLGELDPATLARYFGGECTPEEAATLRAWIDASAERRNVVDQLFAVWRAAGDVEPTWDVERALEEVTHKHAIRLRERGRTSGERTRISGELPRISGERARISGERTALAPILAHDDEDDEDQKDFRRAIRRWKMAAVAVVVLASSFGALRLVSSHHQSAQPKRSASRVFETNVGERATITLSDGTNVTLAPSSKLSMQAAYGDEARDVQLSGEAYFDVVHDAERPFRVHTSRGIAEDLGTTFVVSAYDDMPTARVLVVTGRVAVGAVQLGPGDLGEIGGEPSAVVHGVDVAQSIAWTEGRLVFDGMSLGEAVARLSRWYGADIRLGDSTLARRRVSATFDGESAEQAIDAIVLSLRLRVERRDSVVILYSSAAAVDDR